MWDRNCRPAPIPLPERCEPFPKSLPPPLSLPNCEERTYPCQGCGVVRLEKCMPKQVQTGTEFEYTIRVTNLTNGALTDVVVTDTLNENIQHKSSNPPANVQGNKLIWAFSGLGPKQAVEINGVAVAIVSGILKNCADVTYRMPVCVQSVSVQPNIIITKTAPAEVSICDPIKAVFKVENTGTGPANNVRIIDNLPEGLVTAQGSSKIEIPMGSLLAGTSRSVAVTLRAQRPGTFNNKAIAVADGINVESQTVTTMVKKPVLKITKTGPDAQYLDRKLTYEIAVTNTGDWPAVNTIIEDFASGGLHFVKASRGGTLIKDKVMWKVAKLNPGATAKTYVTYMPDGLGTIVNTATASAVCADAVKATVQTQIKGIPAILLEVVDITDPIKVGDDVTYRITVTNQGSAVGTNIAIKAILESEMGYVSNAGATQGSFAGNTVTFAPLPSLAPKTRASWEVVVKAEAVGDIRFKTTMRSDQLTRDVEETESTNFYE
ncbi:MAG: DUF11 domain-containing protein [Planctomycetes bacterium]|nr:DUF11 domain-containing protein [Planctomycetota bacterium]